MVFLYILPATPKIFLSAVFPSPCLSVFPYAVLSLPATSLVGYIDPIQRLAEKGLPFSLWLEGRSQLAALSADTIPE